MSATNGSFKDREDLTEFNLILQATYVQLNHLFILVEDVRGILQQVLDKDLRNLELFSMVLEFYVSTLRNSRKASAHLNNMVRNSVTLPKDFLPHLSKDHGEKKCSKYLIPFQFRMTGVPQQSRSNILRQIEEVQTFLEQKYETRSFQVDNYLIVMETFTFIEKHQRRILKELGFYKSMDNNEGDQIYLENFYSFVPCEVCDDSSFMKLEKSECNVCAKCKTFVTTIAISRKHLTLKCSNFQNISCKNEFESLDISCIKCRFLKCKALGLFDEYYDTEAKYFVRPENCALCKCQVETSKDLSMLFGILVCFQCLEFLESILINQNFMKYLNLNKCIHARKECTNCFRFKSIQQLGILNLYKEKSGDEIFKLQESPYMPKRALIYNEPNLCCICQGIATSQPYFGLKCCQICCIFFNITVRQKLYAQFNCINGRQGLLCPLEQNSQFFQKCEFCWLRRFEIEGIVDRREISEGHSDLWNPDLVPTIDSNVMDFEVRKEKSIELSRIIDEENEILDMLTCDVSDTGEEEEEGFEV